MHELNYKINSLSLRRKIKCNTICCTFSRRAKTLFVQVESRRVFIQDDKALLTIFKHKYYVIVLIRNCVDSLRRISCSATLANSCNYLQITKNFLPEQDKSLNLTKVGLKFSFNSIFLDNSYIYLVRNNVVVNFVNWIGKLHYL